MMRYQGRFTVAALLVLMLGVLTGLALRADESPLTPAAADACYRKGLQINAQSVQPGPPGTRRTAVTEQELNSYLSLRASPYLPAGLSQPRVNIIGEGKVSGSAIVDLDVVRQRRGSGSALDPMNMLGGKLPVTLTGVVHTRDGQGQFELQDAEVSGFPVPRMLVQQLVSYYTRTPERPAGYDLDQPFALPYRIRSIEVGTGRAVVVQ